MLKKTCFLLIPAVLCVLSLCVFALIACDDGSDGAGGGTVVSCADGVHDFGKYIVQVESNCYRAGAEYRVCSRCNCRDYRDVEIISEHKKVPIPAVDATCSSNGLTEGERCEVCGEIFVMQQSVERLPHTEEVIPAVEATCTTPGHTAGKKCGVCDEILEKPAYIDDGHSYPSYGSYNIRCNVCERLKPIDGLVFELDKETDTYTVIRCEDYTDNAFFSIPMFHEGKAVAKIGESVFATKKIYSLEIPETIVEIGKCAFDGILGSANVKIFGNTRIGEKAFDHSEIKTVEMPNVSYIGKEAFSHCLLLEELKVVTASVIDEMAFEGCSLRSVELCEGVTEIKSNAFADCMITNIVIPSSVTSIVGDVFYRYGEDLVTYYKGTAQKLDEKPQVKGVLSCSTIYYYSETEPALSASGKYDGNFWHYDARNTVVKWEK